MAKFLEPLELEYIDGRSWKVMSAFEYCVGAANSALRVVVPVGFVTDFASIPKLLWNLLPPTGSYGKAAVVHDWLYQHRSEVVFNTGDPLIRLVTRQEADADFLEAMGVLGTGIVVRHIIWGAVRLFGWMPWNRYRRTDR